MSYNYTLSPDERDLMIRMVYAESGNEPEVGQAAVAAVIMNRVGDSRWPDDVSGVITQPSQFEPWGSEAGRARMNSLNNDPETYARIGQIVDSVVEGSVQDPTAGATHFANAQVVISRYDDVTPWMREMQDNAIDIGLHTFFYEYDDARAASAQEEALQILSAEYGIDGRIDPQLLAERNGVSPRTDWRDASDDERRAESERRQTALLNAGMPEPFVEMLGGQDGGNLILGFFFFVILAMTGQEQDMSATLEHVLSGTGFEAPEGVHVDDDSPERTADGVTPDAVGRNGALEQGAPSR